jgi:hypothetical protein
LKILEIYFLFPEISVSLGSVCIWLTYQNEEHIITPMNWFTKGIVLMLMFVWPPVTLTELVLPYLSDLSSSNFSGLPTIGAVAFILVWLVDYGGAFFLLREWSNSPD